MIIRVQLVQVPVPSQNVRCLSDAIKKSTERHDVITDFNLSSDRQPLRPQVPAVDP